MNTFPRWRTTYMWWYILSTYLALYIFALICCLHYDYDDLFQLLCVLRSVLFVSLLRKSSAPELLEPVLWPPTATYYIDELKWEQQRHAFIWWWFLMIFCTSTCCLQFTRFNINSWYLTYLYYYTPPMRTHLPTVIQGFCADAHGLTMK